ncbi:MAG: hypothetical protein CO108_23565 [Deltaproteobacteria bacterium CG_4_9_14_3_um_filter_63_12]|nr:MAG: hypothetical protein CO108_23565 [Deltaproteobacteria bacterium CG_4_9_14_3_um_filter_63_12]
MDLGQVSEPGGGNDLGILPKPVPFGKYYLLEKVNTGGMAEVFKAKTFGVEGFERIVALKRILPSIAEDEEFISMFIDEAKIAGQLNHAHIAQIFDLGKVDGHYFIAMEYIPGRDLRAIFDRASKLGEKLSIAQVSYLIMKLCEGLDYAHNKRDAQGNELGIVHRDVSPQNVLISFEGECKLIDFGIAKAHGKSSSTQVGILKGKFSYMSPEQVRGGKIDRRSDVFSLGIVLYELLTLERLFLGSSDFSTLEKIRKVEFSPPTLFNPHIPQELEDIVLKALTRDPTDRYQSAHEMQEGLQKFMFNQGLYYTNKDLASYTKSAFATEISLEQKKLEYYRTLKKEDLERANAQNGRGSSEPSPGELSWDDEESQTNVFSRAMQSKEDVLAELDNIQLPEDDDIVYAKPKANGSSSGALEVVEKFKAELPPPREPSAALSKSSDWDVGDVKPVPKHSHNAPKKSRAGLIAFFVILFLIVGVLVGWLMLKGGPEYGTVTFNVDPKVPMTIEIDDEIVAKNQTPPFTIEQISASKNHNYRIIAEGYAEDEGIFVVDGGDPINIVVKLTDTTPVSGGTGFSLSTQPVGVKVSVDGVPVEGMSPFVRSALSPGSHKLVVSKDGYKTDTQDIDIPSNTIVQLQIELKPSAIALTLQSEPDGANFIIKSISTGRELKRGKTTDIIKDLPVDQNFEISVFQNGYESVVKTWQPPADRLTETELITLKRKEDKVEPPEIVAKDAHPTKVKEPATIIVKKDQPKEVKAPPKDEVKDPPKDKPKDPPKDPPKDENKTASNAPGILRINCKPPANVIIDGKDYGMTPKKVDLPAGDYTVKLVNVEKGVDATKKVKVEAGKVRTIVHTE